MSKQQAPKDSIPPHSIEAEQGVLGCILQSPQAIHDCNEQDELMQMFFDLRHQTIYDAMNQVFEASRTVDAILLTQKLKDMGELDRVGGHSYISSLPDLTPAAAGVRHYLKILRTKYILRNTIRAARKILDRAMKFDGDIDQFVDESERALLASASSLYKDEDTSIKELVMEVSENIDKMLRGDGKRITGIETGLVGLDEMLDGLLPGNMVVVGGLTGQGKTSLAMTIVDHIAVNLRVPVGVFSMEMTGCQLVTRALCARASVNMRAIRDGQGDVNTLMPKLSAAAIKMSSSPIQLCEQAGLSAMQFTARARRMIQKHGVRVFFVDYLQLMSSGRQSENRQTAMDEISRAIKVFAMETGTTVIALVQMNRELDKDKRKPRLSDIRESGAIAQNADSVFLLWQPNDAYPESMVGVVAKNRFGRMGDMRLLFLREYTRFEMDENPDDVGRTQNQAVINTSPYRDD